MCVHMYLCLCIFVCCDGGVIDMNKGSQGHLLGLSSSFSPE